MSYSVNSPNVAYSRSHGEEATSYPESIHSRTHNPHLSDRPSLRSLDRAGEPSNAGRPSHRKGASNRRRSSTSRHQASDHSASTYTLTQSSSKLSSSRKAAANGGDANSIYSSGTDQMRGDGSARVPYFAAYPRRAAKSSSRDASPYHSDDIGSRSHHKRDDGARSENRTPSHKPSPQLEDTQLNQSDILRRSARDRSSASGVDADRDESGNESDGIFAWPERTSARGLQVPYNPFLQKRLSTSSASTSVASSLSSSPAQPSSSSTNPSSERSSPRKLAFPSMQSDFDESPPTPPHRLSKLPTTNQLFSPAGFGVSAMDALVDSINGGRDPERKAVSDLAHLVSNGWPRAPTSAGTSRRTSPKSSEPASPAPVKGKLPSHATSSTSSRRTAPTAYVEYKRDPVPSSRSRHSDRHSRTKTSSSRHGTRSSAERSSTSTPPSLSRSSGVSSEYSALATPTTERSMMDVSSRSTQSSPAPTPVKAVIPSISDIIRAHTPKLAESQSRASLRSSVMGPPVKSHILGSSSVVPDIAEESENHEGRSSMDSIAEEMLRANTASPSATSSNNIDSRTPTKLPGIRVNTLGKPSTYSVRLPSPMPVSPAPGPGSPLVSPSQDRFNVDSIAMGDDSTTYAVATTGEGGDALARPSSPTREMAQYLRSPRLTRLVKLKRAGNAGVTVSLADVGCASGHPVLLFLGLGCVRYLIGLYDEVAEQLGLRLLCVDRWGLGRSSDVSPEKRGMIEWANVVEEVLDELKIKRFSVLAHSAGSPYALATALRLHDRILGSVHLLAPWVSQSVDGGYKWLKYVPASVIRTAQTAEWKMQGWKIGKPPKIAWEGIGYDATAAKNGASTNGPASPRSPRDGEGDERDEEGRPSINSSEYDDLADFNGQFGSVSNLPSPSNEQIMFAQDFPPMRKKPSFLSFLDARTSRRQPSIGTLRDQRSPVSGAQTPPIMGSRPPSLRSVSSPPGKADDAHALRLVRSKSSLRSNKFSKFLSSSAGPGNRRNESTPDVTTPKNSLPALPPSEDSFLTSELGIDYAAFGKLLESPAQSMVDLSNGSVKGGRKASLSGTFPRSVKGIERSAGSKSSDGRRSASGTARSAGASRVSVASSEAGSTDALSLPPLPLYALQFAEAGSPSPSDRSVSRVPSISSALATPPSKAVSPVTPTLGTNGNNTPTAAVARRSQRSGGITLASALMRASHAEALKGGTADLLSIMERPDSRPWGFNYVDVARPVKVWYGDRDERIGIQSMRWMEKNMQDCNVKIIKGEGHSLLTNSEVVMEVLESIADERALYQ